MAEGSFEKKPRPILRPIFFLLLGLHALAVFLFTRGFLLTRTELSSYSHCHDLPSPNPSPSPPPPPPPPPTPRTPRDRDRDRDRDPPPPPRCWTRPAIDRLVVIVFDALRFDFVAPSTFFEEKKPWMDKLRVLHKLASDEGSSARIFKAIADPPTTSLQRLKLVKNGKRVLMMGDDTWMQLFPEHFEESHPYPSFNVKDLDTVDNGILEHLLPSLYKDDWDVLIAHFLGVDHAGHIFGVDSTPMIKKLDQYNSILEDGEKLCVGTMQQLDFAVTMAALLGVPFPFGSIGRVNPELYALSAGTWDRQRTDAENCKLQSDLEAWMQNYANVLCINCWQVKRYIDLYSATSIIGFSADDLHFVTDLYERALANCSSNTKASCLFGTGVPKEIQDYSVSILQSQIDAYSHFLESVAKLARSAWTEFDLLLMGIGLGILLLSIIIHILAATWVHILFQSYLKEQGIPGLSYRYFLAFLLVAIRAASFLSNSYILAEGRVANFLLGTTGIMNLWRSVEKGDLKKDEFAFLLLNIIIRFGIGFGLSKQTGGSSYLVSDSLKFVGINEGHLRWLVLEIFPIAFLSLLFVFLLKCIAHVDMSIYMKYFTIMGTVLSYVLIATHWASESILIFISPAFQGIGRNLAPRLVYAIGFGILGLSVLSRILDMKERMTVSERLTNSTVPMLSAWSPTILILLGKQGPFVAFVCIAGAWCIISSSKKFLSGTKSGTLGGLAVDPISVTQWSLLAVCLFYLTGHWCTFDGLRYGAAFIGFDHFNIIRQGILLSIDTFGVSHILPILGLPFIVALQYHDSKKGELKDAILLNLSQVFLIYGLITAITTTFTVLCATIQRRHLMVWGLFAPKYVFDAIGLLVTDALICLAVLYYY
ncbi:GPI ethanolamine phosphate transferase 3 [Ananas comosus]|uniref:GPI ethanolamine phosphate transferase 3 n=1 Tax=Ananas comosus TaxID=4615 RepID=A0A199VB31_ANACO|nr:GPI ethanolamine phosphate transferase 3 [Ananas comosus]